MQSENFDKKIKDILNQPRPGNENPAWDKMEKMLDKHLPEKKDDRKRFLLFLFIFLIAGGAAYILWQNGNRDKNDITSTIPQHQNKEQADNNKPGTTTNQPNAVKEENNSDDQTDKQSNQTTVISVQVKKDEKEISTEKKSDETKFTIADAGINKTNSNKRNNKPLTKKSNPVEKTSTTPNTKNEPEKKPKPADINNQQPATSVVSSNNETVKEEIKKSDTDTKVTEQKNETKAPIPAASTKAKSEKQKQKKSFLNNLFITASAVPDVSAVGLSKAGEVKLAYGAGFGYQVSNRFSIRAGYYKGRKVYSADPDDYDPPSNFWNYYPNLKTIDADCKVTELPISVDYRFNQNKKQSWFVSAGVSSLFMKKEVYDYYFKPNYSPNYVTYTRTINNQNKHYFSILNLSGGYTRTIDKHFSIQAEPYFKIAMSGVGYGKVKLNSSGVLFTAIYKPFAKK